MVSTTSASAPPSASARACSAKAARSSGRLARYQHLAARPDGGENLGAARRRAARNCGAGAVELGGLPGQAVAGQRDAVRAEGIAENDAAARFDIGARDLLDLRRPREVPLVGAFAGRQPARLKLGAPGAIGQHRRRGEQLLEQAHAAASLRARATAELAFSL
jgi:hypothetical protein